MPSNDAGQLILVGVPGPELDSESARLFRKIQPGGFILFGRNIREPAQLRKLIDDLRDISDVEPVITIDQEGGRVSRLRLIGNEPPNAQQLRDRDDLDLIRKHGDIKYPGNRQQQRARNIRYFIGDARVHHSNNNMDD